MSAGIRNPRGAAPEAVIRADIRAISAYPVPNAAGMVKLDAMENPYRLPEWLREEIARVVFEAELNRYPDPEAPELKARLRQVMDIPPGCDILLGNGSDEIIAMVIHAVATAESTILAPVPAFVMYRMSSLVARTRFVGIDLAPDFSLDAGRMLAAMSEHRPAVVFIAYPNNPTGNLFSEEAMLRVIERAPGLVVIDEAYHSFARKSFLPRVAEFPNLMVMRTLSKLGLAGLRLGYAAARPEWIREFDKVRAPYNVGVLTQGIGAKILEHPAVLEEQAAAIVAERTRLARALASLPGVTTFPSEANFLLARVPDAERLYEGLRERRVLVRMLHGSHPVLEQCVRFTIGSAEENDALLEALRGLP